MRTPCFSPPVTPLMSVFRFVIRTPKPMSFSQRIPSALDHHKAPVRRNIRNRELPPIYAHFTRFNNSLPISPSEAANRAEFRERMKLGEDEQLPKNLVRHYATRESLKTLADNQTGAFMSHHLQRAGYRGEGADTATTSRNDGQPSEVSEEAVAGKRRIGCQATGYRYS